MSSPIAENAKRKRSSSTSDSDTDDSSDSGEPSGILDVSPKKLASLFECHLCSGFILPPVMQCPGGHLFCNSCQLRNWKCPTCCVLMGQNRNLGIEKVADALKFTCKFRSVGCNALIPYTEKRSHEDDCEWNTFTCPCPYGKGPLCKWEGNVKEVLRHIDSTHENIANVLGDDVKILVTNLDEPGPREWVMIQKCFGKRFMFHLEKDEFSPGKYRYTFLVRFFGTLKEAELFVFRLVIGKNVRRFCHEATPKTIAEDFATIRTSGYCLTFFRSTMLLFKETGKLTLTCTIKRVKKLPPPPPLKHFFKHIPSPRDTIYPVTHRIKPYRFKC